MARNKRKITTGIVTDGQIRRYSQKKQKLQKINVDKFMSLSDEDRYNMSINAFNLAKDKYDSKKIFLEYEKLYNDLIQ